jgi:heterodisulfide reductase subunit B2
MDHCAHLVKEILDDAEAHGAELVSTVCPMCAMNLENYQGRINKMLGTQFDIPIVYLTQLMAVAFGMDPKTAAALDYNIIPPEVVLNRALH